MSAYWARLMTFSNAARIERVQFLGTGQGEGVSMQIPVSLEKAGL